jgi:hypothetical protein
MRKIKTRKEQLLSQGNGNEIFSLCNEAIAQSLRRLGKYSTDLYKEMSAQLVFNLLNALEKQTIDMLPNYIRRAAKNLVINYGMKAKSNQEDPLDMVSLEATDSFTTLDAIIE